MTALLYSVVLTAILPMIVKGSAFFWDDPESFRVWKLPKKVSAYREWTPGRDWVGYLFAGSAEFPWIVDIRGSHYDQISWATGNLITANDVITTCRTAFQMSFVSQTNKGESGKLKLEPLPGLKVNFAAIYLWEGDSANMAGPQKTLVVDSEPFAKQYSHSGSRLIQRIYVHNLCKDSRTAGGTLQFDNGGFRLQHPIFAAPPKVSYMPVPIANESNSAGITLEWKEEEVKTHISRRIMCYVASFGRNFANWDKNVLTDFKVRYRVYYRDWKSCYDTDQSSQYLCQENRNKKCSVPNYETPDLMCFSVRAKLGTVCEHDRGAPIVCGGRVIGIVAIAVAFDYCNDLIQLPFLATKISILKDIFIDLLSPSFDVERRYTQGIKGKIKLSTGKRLLHSRYVIIVSILIIAAMNIPI